MKYFLSFGLLLLTLTASFSQDSLNMKRMALLGDMGPGYTDIWGYTHGSEEFAVIGSRTAVNIVNVSDCANPILTHQWVDGQNTSWRDFKDYKDYIYAVCDNSGCDQGLQVINKNDFSHTSDNSDFNDAHNIYIDKKKGKLFAVGTSGPNSANRGILVYDIKTDPANPQLLKNLNLSILAGDPGNNWYVHDLQVINDTAYCSNIYINTLSIWDLSDLDNVVKISETDGIGGYTHSNWKHPNAPYVYMATETHGKKITAYDISDITNPVKTTEFNDPLISGGNNIAHNPFVYLDRLYISYYHDGVQIYDVSDPEDPIRVGYYDTFTNNTGYGGYAGCWGVYPFLPSGCIVASDMTYGLNTLKMTITPEAKTIFTQGDIIVDDPTRGLVYQTPDDFYIRVTVDDSGALVTQDIGSAPTETMEVINSNLQFSTYLNSVVLRSPNGKYHKVIVTNAGDFQSIPLPAAPSIGVTLESEDIFFSQYRAGLIIKSNDGVCHHYTFGELSNAESTIIDCD